MKHVSLVLVLLMLLGVFTAAPIITHAAVSGDYEYSIMYGNTMDDTYAYITKYKGSSSYPVVPDTLDGFTVKNINMSTFEKNTKIKSVTLPDTLVSISSYAFRNCSNLASIEFPESLNNIANDAFTGTPWLQNQPDGMIYIHSLAYMYKGTCPSEFTIKDGTTVINQNAFSNSTTLEKINIPESVKTIRGSFSGCTALKDVKLPSGLTTLGLSAFSGCTSLESITVPEKITSLYNGVFKACTALTDVKLPSKLKIVGGYAFSGCSALKKITLPDGLEVIEGAAFKDCTSLDDFNIPSSVNRIGQDAFLNTKWYNSQPDGVLYLGKSACACKGDAPAYVEIKDGTVELVNSLFYGSKTIEKVKLPDSVKVIRGYAFRESTIQEINLPNGLEIIEESAFSKSAIKSVSIPGSVKTVTRAFDDCQSLESVLLGDGVEIVSAYAFSSCEKLETLNLPTSLRKIENWGFQKTAIKELVIPEGVETLNQDSFYNCTSMTSARIASTVKNMSTSSIGLYTTSAMDGFVIYGYDGTAAQAYAESKKISFVSLGEPPTQPTEPSTQASSTDLRPSRVHKRLRQSLPLNLQSLQKPTSAVGMS